MTTAAGLSDDRVDAIIRNHEADPGAGDDSHTPREVAQLAREVRARRDADAAGVGLHAERNRLAPFVSVAEALRTLDGRGLVDLSAVPWLREQLEDCHRLAEGLRKEGTP